MRNPSHIGNKLKRSEMYGKYLEQKRKVKDSNRRERRDKEAQALGTEEETTVKNTPKTLDNTRELEPTMVSAEDDVEVMMDESEDEFAAYFSGEVPPKVLITTRPRPSQNTFHFIADLQQLIPGLAFYPRKSFSVKEICQFAQNRQFTHVMILSEKSKKVNGLTISHVAVATTTATTETSNTAAAAETGSGDEKSHSTNDNNNYQPQDSKNDDNTAAISTTTSSTGDVHNGHFSSGMGGPTAFFKVSNVVTSKRIPNHGRSTHHVPELNLHGFGTRLGHRIGRLLGSIFPHSAEFEGRQVVTFHNQRDYLFVRHHRYIFDEVTNAARVEAVKKHDAANPMPNVNTRLQELGPRFTLKLRWIQEGIFDTQFGEYEWIHKRKEMDVTRRKFHL